MRYDLTSIRMAFIKKTNDKKCWQGDGEITTFVRWVGGNVMRAVAMEHRDLSKKKKESAHDP